MTSEPNDIKLTCRVTGSGQFRFIANGKLIGNIPHALAWLQRETSGYTEKELGAYLHLSNSKGPQTISKINWPKPGHPLGKRDS